MLENVKGLRYPANFRRGKQPAFALISPAKPHPAFAHDLVFIALSALARQHCKLSEIDNRVLDEDDFTGANGNGRGGLVEHRAGETGREMCYESAGG